METLKKLAKSTKLSEESVKDIVFEEYLMTNYSKNYKKVDINLTLDSMKFIRKLAKKLKVSEDAIITHALRNHLKSKQ